jgi:hypothetical protein
MTLDFVQTSTVTVSVPVQQAKGNYIHFFLSGYLLMAALQEIHKAGILCGYFEHGIIYRLSVLILTHSRLNHICP